jgi:fructose 1,6-bisphosphatase
LVKNHFAFNVGNNLELPMVQEKDESNHAVRNVAFDAFQEAAHETMKRAREEMQCTTWGQVLERLKLRFKLA